MYKTNICKTCRSNKFTFIFVGPRTVVPCTKQSAMSTNEPVQQDLEESDNTNNFKLSNRGNKLTGEENPGSIRPKMWNNKRSFSDDLAVNDQDFEVQLIVGDS